MHKRYRAFLKDDTTLKNLLLILIFLAFNGCKTKTTENKVVDNLVIETQNQTDKKTETTDIFCDTTKIADFKSNLTTVAGELTANEKEYQLKKANDFIKQFCKRDTLFCGEIIYKKSTTYKYDNEWRMVLTGYVLDQATGMEEESASFFVLTIMRNNEAWFTEILEDLVGEIQVNLNGFEDKDKQITIWGHAYPYFQADYGKFRLIIKSGMTEYEFQCHSQH